MSILQHAQKVENNQIIDGFVSFSPEHAHITSGFDSRFFEKLYEFEKKNFWFKNRARLITQQIKHNFLFSQSFLEIGCGNGLICEAVLKKFNFDVYGSEILVKGLSLAKKRAPDAEFFQMDALSIPFENTFDIIGAFDVLEHIERDDIALSQIHKALAPGGGLILTVPQHKFLWSKQDEHANHVRRYSRKELIDKVKVAGFEIVRVTSFVSLLFPLMAISRFLNKNNEHHDAYDELEISHLLNLFFLELCQLRDF